MAKKNKRKSKQPEYDPPFEPEEQEEQPRSNYKILLIYLLDQDEVNSLIDASTVEYVEPVSPCLDTNHSTYSTEESNELVTGVFRPRKKKKHGNG